VLDHQGFSNRTKNVHMKKIWLVIATLVSVNTFAQKSPKELKGDKYFEIYSFASAIEKYKEVDGLTMEGQRRLAESYKNTGANSKCEETYMALVTSSETTAEDLYNYASVLRSKGKYDQSNTWMNKFRDRAPNDLRALNYTNNSAEFPKILIDEGRYKITALDMNTDQQDFGPAYYGHQIAFTSSREGVKAIRRSYNWNGMPFLDLYVADIDFADIDSDQLNNPVQINKKFNNKMHEGPASFANDGSFMMFTRSNYEGKSVDGTIHLQLFYSSKDENGEWGKEEAFILNSSEYSVGHPSLTRDGKVMYFSSNMPGGKGGVDIYRIERKGDSAWSEPVNLGESINTEGNEMFPFYQESQGVLFFASNGHLGLGGLDIFVSPERGEGEFVKVLNAGTPLNTREDDFALIVDKQMRKGYFSSNREGGKGDDDIYAFELLKPFTFGVMLKGTARDKKGNDLTGTKVILHDSEGNILETVITSETGSYEFTVEADKEFTLNGSKEEYFDGENTASSKTTRDEVIVDLVLEKDPGLSMYAIVTDKKTGEVLEGVLLTVVDNITGASEEYTTPATGDYRRPLGDKKLDDRGSYNFTIAKEGYFTKTLTYNVEFDRPGQFDVHATMDFTLDVEVKDLSELVKINPINFDLNKYKIRPDAEIELDKIVEIMNKYPNMIVELGAHTDCRGSKRYNERLSDQRAKASANFIKGKITQPDRIYGKGFGESKILNGCECEGSVKSDCEEEKHAENRRTEFRVISTGDDKVKVTNSGTDSFE
jgi:outer membrane protein OmpA-like peptidoglycan-associated protein